MNVSIPVNTFGWNTLISQLSCINLKLEILNVTKLIYSLILRVGDYDPESGILLSNNGTEKESIEFDSLEDVFPRTI